MLSETDIHYVTGLLYVVSRRHDINVVLGEKVFDQAAESERDVDIVIAIAGEYGFAGVEVKDEGRRLHVGIVEGICQKFSDMPSISTKAIVSASGYTAPAIKKAKAHGVECLTIVRGKLPAFPTIDLSNVENIPVAYLEWREGPRVTLMPRLRLSPQQQIELSESAPVMTQTEAPSQTRTVRELVDRITACATSEWTGPEQAHGLVPVNLDIEVADQPVISLPSGPIVVTDAVITGVVEWVHTVPASCTCYLADPDGLPFAGAILAQISSGLLGLAVSSKTQELRAFHVPNTLRSCRPTRRSIFGA